MTYGPARDATIITPTIIIPTTARRFRIRRRRASAQRELPAVARSVSDSWIDERIGDIHGQVEDQNDDRNECHDPDDKRLIPVQICIDEVLTEAGKCKH